MSDNNQALNPLVTVIVITYNSAKFVIETLESIKSQTYQDIELVVSDDSSSDNTVQLCKEWLSRNKDRFVQANLITVPRNTGVPMNHNRGVKVANGTWIKFIAGDDVLIDNAVEKLVQVINVFSEIKFLITQVEVYSETFEKKNYKEISLRDWEKYQVLDSKVCPEIQIEYLLNGYSFPSPGFFIKKDLIDEVGGFDNNFPLIEDIPFLLKILFNRNRMYFIPILTVKYRKHSENLTAIKNKILPTYFLQYYSILCKNARIFGRLKFILECYWNYFFIRIIFNLGNSGKLGLVINKFRISLQPKRIFKLFGSQVIMPNV